MAKQKCAYERVNKQKNTKWDLKKVRKSVYSRTVYKRVDVYYDIGWQTKTQDKTDTWDKADEHRHKRQIFGSLLKRKSGD
jgi:hypothetical protein